MSLQCLTSVAGKPCKRPGKRQREGYGFTFCDEHERHFRQVLARVKPSLTDRLCMRGHRIGGMNMNSSGKCKACELAWRRVRRHKLSKDAMKEVADQKYLEIMTGA